MFNYFALFTLLLTASTSYPTGPTQCELCELVVSSSKNFLAANHSTDELQLFFNYTCDLFGRYSPICRGAVSSFVPKLVHILNDDTYNTSTADEICMKLKICQDYDIGVPPLIIDCDEPEFFSTDYCVSLRTSHESECSEESMVISSLCKKRTEVPSYVYVEVNDWEHIIEEM
jgi:hypothetical protein